MPKTSLNSDSRDSAGPYPLYTVPPQVSKSKKAQKRNRHRKNKKRREREARKNAAEPQASSLNLNGSGDIQGASVVGRRGSSGGARPPRVTAGRRKRANHYPLMSASVHATPKAATAPSVPRKESNHLVATKSTTNQNKKKTMKKQKRQGPHSNNNTSSSAVSSSSAGPMIVLQAASQQPSSAYNLSASARPNRAGDSSPACVTPRLSPSALSFSDAVKQRKETSPVPKDRTVRFSLPLNDEKLTAEMASLTHRDWPLPTQRISPCSLMPTFRVSTGHLDCNGDALPSSGSGTSDDSRIPMPAHHEFPPGPLIPWSLLFGSDTALKEAEEKMFNNYKKLIPGHENLFPDVKRSGEPGTDDFVLSIRSTLKATGAFESDDEY